MFRNGISPSCRSLGALLRAPKHRPQAVVRFKKDDKEESNVQNVKQAQPAKSRADKEVDEALKNLRAADSAIARLVLKTWKDAGVTDAKGVRRQLYKAGFSTVAAAALQSAFETVAAYCSFQTANTVAVQDFPFAGGVALLISFFGFYFAVGVVLDLFTIGATISSTILLGTKADVVYASVEGLAAQKSGLGIVDKAQQAVNTGKVILALNSIATALKAKNEDGSMPSMQTLDRLGAMMTLREAEEKHGFDPAKVGVSEDDALKIASQFSSFDTNSDCRLELSEFKRFCDESDFELNEDEVKVAMAMIDKNGDGFIEFDEFCQWWVKSSEERTVDLKGSK